MTENTAEVAEAAPSGDAALIAEMEAMARGDETPEEVVEEAVEETPEVEAAPEATEEPAEAKEATEAKEPSPEEQSSLDRIQRAEERSRAKLAEERAAFDAQVEEMRPHLDEFKSFMQYKGKVNPHNLPEVLASLGLDIEKDGYLASQRLWAMTPQAAENPKAREAALRAQREFKASSEVQELRDYTKKLESRVQSWEQQQVQERQAAEYMGGFKEVISESSSPLTARLVGKNAAKADARIRDMAVAMMDQTGEVPSHAEVVKQLETTLKEELDSLGIDYASMLGKTPAPVADTKTAAKSVKKSEAKASASAEEEDGSLENLSEAELDARLEKELEELVRSKMS